MGKRVTTKQIGEVLVDFLESADIEDEATGMTHAVTYVDDDDPNNLVIHLTNGQMFKLVILSR
jgi:hypothetical protein